MGKKARRDKLAIGNIYTYFVNLKVMELNPIFIISLSPQLKSSSLGIFWGVVTVTTAATSVRGSLELWKNIHSESDSPGFNSWLC